MKDLIRYLAGKRVWGIDDIIVYLGDEVDKLNKAKRDKKLLAKKSAALVDPEVGGLMTEDQVKEYEKFKKELSAADSAEVLAALLYRHGIKND